VTRERQRAELNLWRTGISKQLLSPAGSEGRLNLFWSHGARRKHRRRTLYDMTAKKPDS